MFYSSVWSKWTLNRGGWQYDRPEVDEEGVVDPQDDISVAIFYNQSNLSFPSFLAAFRMDKRLWSIAVG